MVVVVIGLGLFARGGEAAAVLVAAGLPGQSSLALGVLMGLALITSGLGLMAMGAPPARRADAATGR